MKKTLENVHPVLVSKLYLRVIPWSCPSFSFSPNATNTFGKNYFNSNLPVSERWLIQGRPMLVCRCAGNNTLVQKKFCSTIHLQSQHLLSHSHQWNTRWMCKICQKLIKTPEQCHWRCSGVIIVNFTHISHLALMFFMFLLLTWNRQNPGWVVKAIISKIMI